MDPLFFILSGICRLCQSQVLCFSSALGHFTLLFTGDWLPPTRICFLLPHPYCRHSGLVLHVFSSPLIFCASLYAFSCSVCLLELRQPSGAQPVDFCFSRLLLSSLAFASKWSRFTCSFFSAAYLYKVDAVPR